MQVQCNVFEGASGEVALTAAGGLRQLPGLSEIYENAALVHFCLGSNIHVSIQISNDWLCFCFPFMAHKSFIFFGQLHFDKHID